MSSARLVPLTRPLIRLTLAMTALVTGCGGGGEPTAGTPSVRLVATGLSDGKLARNATATFTAVVTGAAVDRSGLRYRWTLTTGRGELSDGSSALPNPTVGDSAMRTVGRTAGDERVVVSVVDAAGAQIATATVDFTIVAATVPSVSRGCFDQPKILFQAGATYQVVNFDGSGRQSIGASGGTSVAISPNGEWIAWNASAGGTWDMHVQRCDGSGRTVIPGGTGEDFSPHFSPDSRTLYFRRPEPSQPKPFNAGRLPDIVAYDLASRELRFLTTVHREGQAATDLTVSPVTGDIAFFRESYVFLGGGEYVVTHRLSFVRPASGVIRDFTTLPSGRYDFGLDWSPDGSNIIFAGMRGTERGIYRIGTTDGSTSMLLFPNPIAATNPPLYPHYYAGGSRIVFGYQSNLWSIDANGSDVRQLTSFTGTIFMQGVLH